jgi:two-component system nitrogen regulation response regulator NtrX
VGLQLLMRESPSNPRLILIREDRSSQECPLQPGIPLVLGRSSSCDLRLEGDRVSRRHARLLLEGGQVQLEDLGSTSGTRINGRLVQKKQLAPGDLIEIGSSTLRLEGLTPTSLLPAGSDTRLLALLTDLLTEDKLNSEALLGAMLRGLLEVFEADRGLVFLPEATGGFSPAAQRSVPGSMLADQAPVSRQLIQQISGSSTPVLLTTSETEELRETFRSIPRITRSVLAAPLPLPEGVGVLYLDSVLERRKFQQGDGDLLLAFSRAAGMCLGREKQRRQASRQSQRLAELQRRELETHRMIGTSPAMNRVREEVQAAASSEVTVLITGQSGTGKELVAQALHRASPRSQGSFVAVNCAAIPPELVESELFGHEKGAFTGAESRRLGHFELADGGTLFLDEVGELRRNVQGKLLRALQEKSVQRVGASTPIPVNFRLVTATNVDLEEAVKSGQFREDLFYRIAVFRVRLPPLKERDEDVLAIARIFVQRFARDFRKPLEGLDEEAQTALLRHPWPGNIRELRNVIEQAVVRESGPRLSLASLAPALGQELVLTPGPASLGVPEGEASWEESFPESLEAARREFEARFLVHKLRHFQGNMKATAEGIGLSRRGLYDKCNELEIDYKSFR